MLKAEIKAGVAIALLLVGGVSMAAPVQEVVLFTVKPAVSAKVVEQTAKRVTGLLKQYPGFISRNMSQSATSPHQWLDVVCWQSLNDAKAAATHSMTNKVMQRFVALMQHYQMFHFQHKLGKGGCVER